MTPVSQTRRDLLKGAAALAAAAPSARGSYMSRPAHAQGSAGPARARIDGVLRQSVDAKIVPGVVAMAADRQGRALRGRLRPARAGARRGRDDARHRLPHRIHDQGDHLGRGDAARRAGQAQAGRPGAEHRSRAGLAPGARRVRRLGRAQAPPREAADHPAPPAHPHRRVQLRHLGREHRTLHQGVGHARAVDRQGGVHPHAADLRSGRPLGVRRQHRLGGPPRRGDQRPAARRLLPRQDLRAARHEGQRLRAPRPSSARARRGCTCARPTGASSRSRSRRCRWPASSGRAAARSTRRAATTSSSCRCCCTAGAGRARAC